MLCNPCRSTVLTTFRKRSANPCAKVTSSLSNGLRKTSSFKSRSRWIRHFCCGQGSESKPAKKSETSTPLKGQPFQGHCLLRSPISCEVATCSPCLYRRRGGGFLGPRGVLR